jgi:hypothetical protein
LSSLFFVPFGLSLLTKSSLSESELTASLDFFLSSDFSAFLELAGPDFFELAGPDLEDDLKGRDLRLIHINSQK